MQAEFSLEVYLKNYCLTTGAITSIIKEKVGQAADDILFLGGSLIEGYGNNLSDIDAFLITSRESCLKEKKGSVIFLDLTPCPLDIEIIYKEEIHHWASLINGYFGKEHSDPRDALLFSTGELKTMHRFLNGFTLYNEDELKRLKQLFDPLKLADLLFMMTVAIIPTLQIDLLGSIMSEVQHTIVYNLQSILDCLFKGLLALHGNTNMSEKWLYHLLSIKMPPEWDRELPGGPLELPVHEYYSVMRNFKRKDFTELNDYIIELTCLINRIIPWGQKKILKRNTPDHTSSGGKGKSEYKKKAQPQEFIDFNEKVPCLNHAVQILYENNSYKIQLVHKRMALYVNEQAYIAMVLFNGKKTLNEVAEELFHHTEASREELIQHIKYLSDFAIYYGFSYADPQTKPYFSWNDFIRKNQGCFFNNSKINNFL